MNVNELDFDLSAELIAQHPKPDRAGSRLLHFNRATGAMAHRRFSDLPSLLRPGDLLVFNDARVVPAKFTLRKPTGGLVEGLFVAERSQGMWTVMLKNLGTTKIGARLTFVGAEAVSAVVRADGGAGMFDIEVSTTEPANILLSRIGRMPLPPYIRRQREHDPADSEDRNRYQTVYARAGNAVAAPTAGLHFTDALLAELNDRGIERAFLTLHVGLGTFKSVTAERLEDHAMHVERYEISETTSNAVNRARDEGRRIVAVGTTSARVLESIPADRPLVAGEGETGICIYPPYAWKRVDALVTNFHLPRSTLIALVAAFVGLDAQRRIYAEAIGERYRFFSYGDASFLE